MCPNWTSFKSIYPNRRLFGRGQPKYEYMLFIDVLSNLKKKILQYHKEVMLELIQSVNSNHQNNIAVWK